MKLRLLTLASSFFALLGGCSDRGIQSDEMSVESEYGVSKLSVYLRFYKKDLGSVIPDGDVAYLYVFECENPEDFKAFGEQTIEDTAENIAINYSIPLSDPFLSKLKTVCGQFGTTGYALSSNKSFVFEIRH
ncbi:hypothetical protein ACWPMX_08525 [Tsuneonella sp. HG094]